jgi:hypothetical protein
MPWGRSWPKLLPAAGAAARVRIENFVRGRPPLRSPREPTASGSVRLVSRSSLRARVDAPLRLGARATSGRARAPPPFPPSPNQLLREMASGVGAYGGTNQCYRFFLAFSECRVSHFPAPTRCFRVKMGYRGEGCVFRCSNDAAALTLLVLVRQLAEGYTHEHEAPIIALRHASCWHSAHSRVCGSRERAALQL